MAARAASDPVYTLLSTAVDAAFYWAVYPDLAEARVDPIGHYLHSGWQEGRDPAPWFSTRGYLELNNDIGAAGLNPLHHYLMQGWREGREIRGSGLAPRYYAGRQATEAEFGWSFDPGAPPRPTPPTAVVRRRAPVPPTPVDRAAVAVELDPAYYLGMNPDVARSGADPVEHFLNSGWREGRDPNPNFSLADYLEAYPDVADAGINPFAHYLAAGRAEGRIAKRNLGFRYDVIAAMPSMADRLARVAARSEPPPLGSAADLAAAFAASKSGLADLHVTFSHDDYTTNLGGVQLCLQRESRRVGDLGRDHLHIFPGLAWPTVRTLANEAPVGVLWNEVLVGYFPPALVAQAFGAALAGVAPGRRSFAIHSLLGHAAQDVLALLAAAGLHDGFFWLHDFASLCGGYHLLRDDVADCGAPPPESPACTICVYGETRRAHIGAHARLFEGLSLTVVAPSQVALDTWRAGGEFPHAGEVVHPHATLTPAGPAPARPGPFRFAYLGVPAPHKGWPIFRDLALRFAGDPRYAFLYLGKQPMLGLPIEAHPVSVSEDDPLAMRDAVQALGVDAAMIWSLCRETFSFTAHEAVAAGAAVVTGPDSGNVAAFVEAQGHGRVLPDEAALAVLFETGEILELARARRKPSLYDLAFSALTVDLLEGGRA
jgi:hypothetical protein